MFGAAAENVLAEVDEGLRRTRDVAVALPRKTDVDSGGRRERYGANSLHVADNHVEQESDAHAARDKP